MTSRTPPNTYKSHAWRVSSSAHVGDHRIQVAIDREGNFAVLDMDNNPKAIPAILRLIADYVESEADDDHPAH